MFPKRGTVAAVLTAVVLVLLLTFKTPDQLPFVGSVFAPQNQIPSLVAYADPQTGAAPASASTSVSSADGSAPGAADSGSAPVQPPIAPVYPSAIGPAPTGIASPTTPRTQTAGVVPLFVSTSALSPTAGTTMAPTNQPAAASPTGSNPASGATPKPGANPTTAPTTASTAPPAPPAPAPTNGITGSFDGSTVQMKYGPVQVRAVYSNGKITDVVALQMPTADSHSVQIAQRAAPILRSEALAAQSAKVNTVSGATYTSNAYKTSLQSAIDKA